MSVKLNWTRNKYSGRGILREQDVIAEFQLAGKCVICGRTKERKRQRDGSLEKALAFRSRKTCGKVLVNNEWQWSNCLQTIPQGKRWEPGCEGWLLGKTFDEAFGKDVAKEMKQKLSYEMKHKLATGKIDVTKPKVESVCSVCGKVTLDSPWRAKNRVVCSLKCAGSKNGRAEWIKNNYTKFVAQQKTRRHGKYHNCEVCKKEFYTYPSTRQTGKYCSKACEVSASRTMNECTTCHQEFQVRKSEAWKIKNCLSCRKS